MKNCIRIPRLYLPRENFETWAVFADSALRACGDWERVGRAVGGAPSALRFLMPEMSGQERAAAVRREMYRALAEDRIEKLVRGMVVTERTLTTGVRRGFVAALDLEEIGGAVALASTAGRLRIEELAAVREKAPLEVPHTVVLYRDKKGKILKSLDIGDLEELYRFRLFEGGEIAGYFLPEYDAAAVAEDMHSRGEPQFVVAEGCDEAAAAKRRWEALKPTLKAEELRNHPARFLLAEFVNVYDDAVTVRGVHRVLRDVEADAFCSYFAAHMKCRREGNTVIPLASGADAVRKCGSLLAAFLSANGGSIVYAPQREEAECCALEEDSAALLMPYFEKEELFSVLKSGPLPPDSFLLGDVSDMRYHLEGREISYD